MTSFVAELKKQHSDFLKAEANNFAKAQAKKQRAFMSSQKRQTKARRTENSPLRNDDFYYTDAPKYAEKYYGETFRETTRFDNDWD